MPMIPDHPKRYQLSNELHARPFPRLSSPACATFLALTDGCQDGPIDKDKQRSELIRLLDRFGAPHPQPGATHYSGPLGKQNLKWELHTEFVTYTLFGGRNAEVAPERAFDPVTFGGFPAEWLAAYDGLCVTSVLINIETQTDDSAIDKRVESWLVRESLSVSRVLDDALVIAGDFRIDPTGQMRFAAFARPETGPGRIGRVVQRLCEIETYKAMSMLGFSKARDMAVRISQLDASLTTLIEDMGRGENQADDTLKSLLGISAELEDLMARTNYRFEATRAYAALVHQRIEILREEPFAQRQSFAEFMMRRFDPAMRTVAATQQQLNGLTQAATRAGELLRTRVDVARSAQNQQLLESMDRRSDQQLRLQSTVEGLSVVAISYYAVNLVTYMVAPMTTSMNVPKTLALAVLTPAVVCLVWLVVRRIRKRAH